MSYAISESTFTCDLYPKINPFIPGHNQISSYSISKQADRYKGAFVENLSIFFERNETQLNEEVDTKPVTFSTILKVCYERGNSIFLDEINVIEDFASLSEFDYNSQKTLEFIEDLKINYQTKTKKHEFTNYMFDKFDEEILANNWDFIGRVLDFFNLESFSPQVTVNILSITNPVKNELGSKRVRFIERARLFLSDTLGEYRSNNVLLGFE